MMKAGAQSSVEPFAIGSLQSIPSNRDTNWHSTIHWNKAEPSWPAPISESTKMSRCKVTQLLSVLSLLLGFGTSYMCANGRSYWRCGALKMSPLSREDEIRRKIVQLKKKGKIQRGSEPVDPNSYEARIRKKLGKKKSKMLGFGDDDEDEEALRIQEELDGMEDDEGDQRQGAIGAIRESQIEGSGEVAPISSLPITPNENPADSSTKRKLLIDPSLFDGPEQPEMSEEELIEAVSQKLVEKREAERAARDLAARAKSEERQTELGSPKGADAAMSGAAEAAKTTSGVGGTWVEGDRNSTDFYKPKSGSWGAFPRPKDISKAYGGGRRVGAGFSNEEDVTADMNTKRLLREYRIKVGIEVPTEKEHASEIEEALQIGQLAMQRGIYATAVSALEKVTKWCSTNSKVGSKVFLELAMAYEAVGRTQEAYQVYQTLTQCRMEDVKFNAKRLLYGMEAMELMKGVSSDFSRKQIRTTFMDATGLNNIAQNFDDVYQTAYVDLDGGFYKRLTESVVRSNREARQILLKATGKGEVGRKRIVQALRSISRHFDEALESEIAANKKIEPTAFIDGKPLIAVTQQPKKLKTEVNLDDFVLASADQMLENIDGTWQLQLLADKSGDGVSFFNTTIATQEFSIADMSFSASGPAGLSRIEKSGEIAVDEEKRIITRPEEDSAGQSGIFSIFGSSSKSGFAAAVSRQQQIMTVDSVLLVTKSPAGSRKGKDAEKEYFSVWRKIQTRL
eukprot:scaffold818_cov136-Cylindrotheca_fusiformis.AAC.24